MAAKKRSPDQIIHDRARIAELKLQQYTDAEIRDILVSEGSVEVSRRQINNDVKRIRENWMSRQYDSYELLVTRELARIDALERHIWQEVRASASPKERSVIEEVARKVKDADEMDDEEYDLFVTKVTRTLEGTRVNPSLYAQIQECHKERRRLLGLYAPQQIGVQKTVVVKGYKEISPDDWDKVIEGELIE